MPKEEIEFTLIIMKRITSIICLLILFSCSKEISEPKLEERGGIKYEVNSTETFTGTSVNYFSDGQLKGKINYKDGKKDGVHESFYKNGKLRFKKNYKDGKLHGLSEEYYFNGQLDYQGNFKDGKEDGIHQSYYENGQLVTAENYKNGKLNGLHERFFEDGQMRFRSIYIDGVLGPYEMFFEDGRIEKSVIYEDGQRVVREYNNKTGQLEVRSEKSYMWENIIFFTRLIIGSIPFLYLLFTKEKQAERFGSKYLSFIKVDWIRRLISILTLWFFAICFLSLVSGISLDSIAL